MTSFTFFGMMRLIARYGSDAEINISRDLCFLTEIVQQGKEVTQTVHVGASQRFGKQLHERREFHRVL